nr:MAG TPA: hypothetical protein [Caudoviricetes sp.]
MILFYLNLVVSNLTQFSIKFFRALYGSGTCSYKKY